jgi:hypothetical protein
MIYGLEIVVATDEVGRYDSVERILYRVRSVYHSVAKVSVDNLLLSLTYSRTAKQITSEEHTTVNAVHPPENRAVTPRKEAAEINAPSKTNVTGDRFHPASSG